MKIVYTPIATLVPSLTPEQDAEILAAAGDDSVLVVAKTPDRQREEIVDANVLFGRVSPEIFAEARQLRYYHCLGAGVDSVSPPGQAGAAGFRAPWKAVSGTLLPGPP